MSAFPNETRSWMKECYVDSNWKLREALILQQTNISLLAWFGKDLKRKACDANKEKIEATDSAVKCSSTKKLKRTYNSGRKNFGVKLSCIGKYRLRLRERDRRKRIARSHSLISTSLIPNKNCKTPTPKRKFIKEDREFLEKMKVYTQFQMSAEVERLQEGVLKEKEDKSKITQMVEFRKQGLTVLNDVDMFDEEKYKREKRKENKKKMNSLATPKRNSTVSKKAEGKVEKLDILIDDDGAKDEEEELVEDSKEMACMPGYDMLSEREKKLCNSIKMIPANYITIKTCIIQDYLQRKQGVPVKIRFPSGMDKTHRRRIMSFLSDNGWIGVT